MSDQRTQLESDGYPRSETSTGFSSNGSDPAEAAADPSAEAVATAEAPEADAAAEAPTAEATSDAPEADATVDAPTGEATATDGETAAPAVVAEAAGETPIDDGAAFLAALAQAMQSTAEAEKARIIAEMDARRDALVASVRARRESDATRMRELADEDLKGIDSWATAERERIQAERERRAQVVRADLELSLTQHGSKIDREIEVVEAAITAYRADVEAFFANIERETPIAVAQQAGRRPVFPSIETISSAETTGSVPASSEAVDATPAAPVGVMDPDSPAKPIGAWRAWTEMSASADAIGGASAATDPVDAGETPAAEPVQVPVASGSNQSDSGSLVHAMPVSRPMSWLRRDHQNDDPNS
ncbi:MAG: hypothetical protein QOD78_2007 [Chloroflexota bacterium]|nr:hypothetical protein [Chloroflexota bacterium]